MLRRCVWAGTWKEDLRELQQALFKHQYFLVFQQFALQYVDRYELVNHALYYAQNIVLYDVRMLVVVVRVFPSHLRTCNVIEARNSAEIRGSGSKSETQIDLQIDQN